MRLLTVLLFVTSLAYGQSVIRLSAQDAYLPLITGSQTVKNDSSVVLYRMIETRPGYQYAIQEQLIPDSVLIQAEAYASMSGVSVSGSAVGSVDKTDWLKYSVNLKKPRTKILYTYAMSDATNGAVEFRIGSATATPFATAVLSPTGGWSTYQTKEIVIPAYGNDATVDLYITFTTSVRTTGSGGNIDWIMFK